MIKEMSIYIHIPFCNSKCYYCSFVSFVQNDQIKKEYFKALKNEILEFKINKCDSSIALGMKGLDCHVAVAPRNDVSCVISSEEKRNGEISNNYIIKTIYFGGGTPSCVKAEFIGEILEIIREKFKVDKNAEITIECNPNSTDESKLAFYKKIGINRLSFGVQSFNKHSLDFVGRIQNDKNALKNYKKNTIKILKKAKALGFKNISADFILGLVYQSNFQLKRFIKKLCKLVCHFSCYMLMVEEGTKLFELMPKGVDDEILARQYETAVKKLKKLGFERYEISNFAKSGFESKHNQVYWNMGEYIGFGLSSHSFYNHQRIANTENLEEYINCYNAEISPLVSLGRDDTKKESRGTDSENIDRVILSRTSKKQLPEESPPIRHCEEQSDVAIQGAVAPLCYQTTFSPITKTGKGCVILSRTSKKQLPEESPPIKTAEPLSAEQLAEETIMLALRTREGLDLVKFKTDFYNLEESKKSEIARLLNAGFIEFKNNFLKLSDKGYLVSSKIILELVA